MSPSPPESDQPERVLYEGNPALIPSLGALLVAVLTVGLGLVWLWLRAKSTSYRITSERIVVERGLFSKRMEQIDVYRINDFVVELPFGQRVMGTGNLIVDAMDRTTPHLHITGLKTDVRALYEKLREATEQQKSRRGVRVVDYE
jgi:uncharacterized membrane protein YdbT with pleckstrin-like domain